MNRLPRFEAYRYVGTREDMRVHDCDDPEQLEGLRLRVDDERLLDRLQLQAFSPDTLEEAKNRGFTPVRVHRGSQ